MEENKKNEGEVKTSRSALIKRVDDFVSTIKAEMDETQDAETALLVVAVDNNTSEAAIFVGGGSTPMAIAGAELLTNPKTSGDIIGEGARLLALKHMHEGKGKGAIVLNVGGDDDPDEAEQEGGEDA